MAPPTEAPPTEALRRGPQRRADGPLTEVFRTTIPPQAPRTEALRKVPVPQPEAPRTEALRRVPRPQPEVPQTEALCRVPQLDAPRTEVLPRVPRPAEERARVVWWHGDHLRTEALGIVPRHADGPRPATRPGPRHGAGTLPPMDRPADRGRRPRPHRTPRPASWPPPTSAPRWRPGDRMEHLFEQRCDATPHQPAVEPENGPPLTFAELDARANQLARHLLARGRRRG